MTTVTITTRKHETVDMTPDPKKVAAIRAKQRAAQMPKPPRPPDGDKAA